MATQHDSQEQFTYLLNTLGIRDDTKAIFRALLDACEDKKRLSEFVLESISARLNISTFQPGSEGFETRLMTESIDDEGRRWLTDFLLIAIGKRSSRRERTFVSPVMLSPQSEGCMSVNDTETLEISSTSSSSQSGNSASFSGKTAVGNPLQDPNASQQEDLQFVRLFPESGDPERWSRFRVLVNVFHKGFEGSLSDSNLISSRNGIYMGKTLRDQVDEGSAHFVVTSGQVFAVSLQPMLAIIPAPTTGTFPIQRYGAEYCISEDIDLKLVQLHGAITRTWIATGFSSKFISDKRWIEGLSPKAQNASVLGVDIFSGILQHRLAII